MTFGNSGGVLINEEGKVIGITTAMITNGLVNYMNMAIPINKINSVKRNINVSMEEYHNMHKVFSFYSDGKVLDTQEFVSGNKITKIDDPTRIGYIFDGWYTSNNFETPFDFSSSVENETACYAKWTPITYTINYYLNGGENNSNNLTSYTIRYGKISLKEPTKNGYTFKGWYRDEDFKGSVIDKIDASKCENISLYAKWEIANYRIIYNMNGGKFTSTYFLVTSYTMFDNVNISYNTYVPIKEGYTFDGWYDNKDFTGEKITEIKKGSTGDINLYAKFTIIVYKITYYLDNGIIKTPYPETYTVETESFKFPTPYKAGYEFIGWKGWFNNTSYGWISGINKGRKTGDLSLTAQYKIIE